MKLVREPLLHFLLLGAAIFLIHGLVSKHSADRPVKLLSPKGKWKIL